MSTCWILVANAARGTLYRSDAQLGKLTEVRGFQHPESRVKVSDLLSDDRGRTRAGPNGNHSALDAHTDPRRNEAAEFARELGETLRAGRVRNAYDEVLVVAPPRFLGLLRDELDPETARTVTQEIGHDWTSVADARELSSRIRATRTA
jgi:protein required for attachment to host cells